MEGKKGPKVGFEIETNILCLDDEEHTHVEDEELLKFDSGDKIVTDNRTISSSRKTVLLEYVSSPKESNNQVEDSLKEFNNWTKTLLKEYQKAWDHKDPKGEEDLIKAGREVTFEGFPNKMDKFFVETLPIQLTLQMTFSFPYKSLEKFMKYFLPDLTKKPDTDQTRPFLLSSLFYKGGFFQEENKKNFINSFEKELKLEKVDDDILQGLYQLVEFTVWYAAHFTPSFLGKFYKYSSIGIKEACPFMSRLSFSHMYEFFEKELLKKAPPVNLEEYRNIFEDMVSGADKEALQKFFSSDKKESGLEKYSRMEHSRKWIIKYREFLKFHLKERFKEIKYNIKRNLEVDIEDTLLKGMPKIEELFPGKIPIALGSFEKLKETLTQQLTVNNFFESIFNPKVREKINQAWKDFFSENPSFEKYQKNFIHPTNLDILSPCPFESSQESAMGAYSRNSLEEADFPIIEFRFYHTYWFEEVTGNMFASSSFGYIGESFNNFVQKEAENALSEWSHTEHPKKYNTKNEEYLGSDSIELMFNSKKLLSYILKFDTMNQINSGIIQPDDSLSGLEN